jgi:hypothetical protein
MFPSTVALQDGKMGAQSRTRKCRSGRARGVESPVLGALRPGFLRNLAFGRFLGGLETLKDFGGFELQSIVDNE